MENLKNTEFGQDANLRAKKKLTNRTDVLDKAHLSLDDKAKTKALLDRHKAIQESEDNEEGGSDPPPRQILEDYYVCHSQVQVAAMQLQQSGDKK
ncbi:hypothetical protein ABFA07_017321 [Porites harrisoni]